MKIRKARKEDFEDYFDLQKEFYELEQYQIKKGDKIVKLISRKPNNKIKKEVKKEFAKLLRQKNRLFLALDDKGKMIGYIHGKIKPLMPELKKVKCCHISDLIVSKKYRGKGLGKRLEKEFIKWAKKKGIKWIHLDVFWHNDKARKAYLNWGYELNIISLIKKVR